MIQPLSITCALLSLIFSATAVWSQGLPVANCWLDAPVVSEASITVDVVPQNITGPDGRKAWSLFALVSWERPAGLEPDDVFVLKITSFDKMTEEASVLNTDPCLVTGEEIIEPSTVTEFSHLSFNQLYEIEIYLFRPSRQHKSITGAIKAFQTPDCLEVTGDMDFCMNQVTVQYSGAPMDPHVNSLCRNSSTSLLRVSLSWLPPFQVNGNVFLYSIDYGVVVTPAPDVVVEPPTMTFLTRNVFPPSLPNGTNQTDSRISATLNGLEEGKLYYVRITPIVDSPVDGGKYPGDEVELTFVTANWTDPMGETTEINLATPLCEVLDDPTTVPTENDTFIGNSTMETTTAASASSSISVDATMMSTATTPARLPPSKMEPAHIALIVIFSTLILLVVVAFIVITIRMAKTGHVTKLPPLSQIPAMCKKQSEAEGGEKTKNLSMTEKGVKTANEKKTKETSKPN